MELPRTVSNLIRPAVPADTPAIIALAIATGMFLVDEVEPLREVLDGFHASRLGADHRLDVWADVVGGKPIGVVYFGPNTMCDRTWDLWMIAVAPERQGQGIGSELIRFVEAHVRAGDGRLLFIETSSLPKYDATRMFYTKHGYAEVAHIPDFYADGDSKVIFSKRVTPVSEKVA
jgi:ribosomal protein S18 acetylase RimI-like enzyme